jgi:hypothetical protein
MDTRTADRGASVHTTCGSMTMRSEITPRPQISAEHYRRPRHIFPKVVAHGSFVSALVQTTTSSGAAAGAFPRQRDLATVPLGRGAACKGRPRRRSGRGRTAFDGVRRGDRVFTKPDRAAIFACVSSRVRSRLARHPTGISRSGAGRGSLKARTHAGGSDGRRSRDLTIFSRALYQLSYRAVEPKLYYAKSPSLRRGFERLRP